MTDEEYIQLFDKARQLATEAHKGQNRKFTNEPYIMHPTRVQLSVCEMSFTNQEDKFIAAIVALLHDVIEDCDEKYQEAIEKNFPQSVIYNLNILTHSKDMSYHDYVMKIANSNQTAIKVKICDIKDNLNGLHPGSMRDKYELALHILEKCLSS